MERTVAALVSCVDNRGKLKGHGVRFLLEKVAEIFQMVSTSLRLLFETETNMSLPGTWYLSLVLVVREAQVIAAGGVECCLGRQLYKEELPGTVSICWLSRAHNVICPRPTSCTTTLLGPATVS